MNIPKQARERLVQELRFVADSMAPEADPLQRMYLFSGAYGEAARLLNVVWDRDIALIHMALQVTYSAANNRVGAMAGGRERGPRLPDNFFEMLIEATRALANVVETRRDADLCKVLGRFAELSYLTTGNGYYLYLKKTVVP